MLRRVLSWLHQKVASKAQELLLRVLAAGPIPKHVAFVMDGNRRYARRNHKAIKQGHTDGFAALKRMLEICLYLDVKCVSAYAFAIENFKRSPEEVDALMTLAEEKLLELCEHGDLLEQYGVRLNVLGKSQLLPQAVRSAVDKAESMTRHNNRAVLNLCMPYASRDEITTAVERCVNNATKSGSSIPSITEKDVDAQLMTTRGGSPPVDILIRTSGVTRLSDFFLWQCCENTQIQFSSTYWPEFGLFDFVPMILDYQMKIWMQKEHTCRSL